MTELIAIEAEQRQRQRPIWLLSLRHSTRCLYAKLQFYPIASMYGMVTYIYHEDQLNVGKSTIHGWYGYTYTTSDFRIFSNYIPTLRLTRLFAAETCFPVWTHCKKGIDAIMYPYLAHIALRRSIKISKRKSLALRGCAIVTVSMSRF